MKTFATPDPLDVARAASHDDQLKYLRDTYGGPKAGESVNDWLSRLHEEEKVVLLTRTEARNLQTLEAAQAYADQKGLLLVRIEDPRPKKEGPMVSLTREQAHDPFLYRAAKEKAERIGGFISIAP